ncbi:polyprenyl synthetase family protein [Acinetobacter puyangensis]|uniref:polyprenyl synthetase family protein n=1 Tax=Acinetobacter puyangensis TaxID=1096779 RepID=UPI003A4DA720
MILAPQALLSAQQQIQRDLHSCLDYFDLPHPLKDAVHHAVMLGGKRVRPALVYASVQLNGDVMSAAARRAAVAVELIHCYSLTHDDLPCMDNDELRRGQPTCHVAYSEATALLAGDILQSMAFEVLGSRMFDTADLPDPAIALRQMQLLATASSKMVCGQVLDLQAEGQSIDQSHLENIHRNKTGALIQAAIMLGATTVLPVAHPSFAHLRVFGQSLGLAFQVQDDILDITADTKVLGKTAGKDIQVQKSTYPALLGLEAAQVYTQQLHDQALEALQQVTGNTQPLQDVTQFLLHRQS